MDDDNVEVNVTPTNVVIASYAWNIGRLSAAFYNISTFELSVAQEIVDLKPDFWNLKDLFRRTNSQTVLASGTDVFLKQVMKLLGMPDESNAVNYRINRMKSTTLADFIVYTSNENSLLQNRNRILQLRLAGMSTNFNEQERCNFIESVLPLGQNLVVNALGNLLNYLDTNAKHLFLQIDRAPIIANVTVQNLNSYMLMDASTFDAMQVFVANEHPSSFKRNDSNSAQEGLSLFRMINTCVSRIGQNELKIMLHQPTRKAAVLNMRYDSIDWLRDARNSAYVDRLCKYLKNIGGVAEQFVKLISTQGKPRVWKKIIDSIYYAIGISTTCSRLVENSRLTSNTIFHEFVKYAEDVKTLKKVYEHINYVFDIDESLKLDRFCVRFELDAELDQMKNTISQVLGDLEENARQQFQNLPAFVTQITVHFVHELGFLVAFPIDGLIENDPAFAEAGLEFVSKTNELLFFKTPLCLEMNEKYAKVYVDICEREQSICKRLVDYVKEYLPAIQSAVHRCAELDCLIALAKFAAIHNLVKPILTQHRQVLQITEGRHILLETQGKFITNDTDIHADKRNLVNVIIAPNASGKSVYLKLIAQIAYLAHIGSFVPARCAKMSIYDAIYTRIYSPESIYQSKSSFMIELQQMGHVMSNSSCHSLILIDEFGRGTTELDGKALLSSCLEHLIWRAELAPIAFITTHFHDIYERLPDKSWICLKTFMMVAGSNDTVLSTYKLCEGRCMPNYARKCAEVKDFLATALGPKSRVSDNAVDGADESTMESIVSTANVMYNAKVMDALNLLVVYLNNYESQTQPRSTTENEDATYNLSMK